MTMSAHSASQSLQQARARVNRLLDDMDSGAPVSAGSAFRVATGKEHRFDAALAVLAAAASHRPGLRSFRHREGPADCAVEYRIQEDWDSAGAFRAWWNSPAVQQFQQQAEGLVVSSPEIQIDRGAWDTNGKPVDLKGSGQDGEFRAGIPIPSPRFRDNRDGTVTDCLTNLTWLQDADAFPELPWMEAMRAPRTLADGSHGLKDGSRPGDWRAPNIRELLSLLDYGSDKPPILTKNHPFKRVRPAIYWVSTSLFPAPHISWQMTLGIGPTVFDLKTSRNRLWPVRGNQSRVPKTGQKQCFSEVPGAPPIACAGTGQDGELQAGAAWPEQRFTDNGDGTVTDHMTNLVWLKNGNPFGLRTWAQGLALCNALESGMYGLHDGSRPGDWRMPNIREAESLNDYGMVGPCLPAGHPFENVRPSSYWTSTSVTCAPSEAMFIIYGVGPAIFEMKEHPFFIWPVRNQR